MGAFRRWCRQRTVSPAAVAVPTTRTALACVTLFVDLYRFVFHFGDSQHRELAREYGDGRTPAYQGFWFASPTVDIEPAVTSMRSKLNVVSANPRSASLVYLSRDQG